MDATSLLFISVLSVALASPSEDAKRALLSSYLKKSGIEDNLTRTGKYYERQVPEDVRFYVGYAAYISKTVVDKKIVFQWRF